MMPKINITGDGITLSMKVDGEYKPFVSCDDVGVQLRDYITYVRDTMTEETSIRKAFNELEGEECCPYCKYCDECSGIVAGPNGPIYPACADALDASRYLSYEAFKRDYLGEFNKKEEIKMNKVLELYKKREEKRIKDKYTKLKEDMYNDNLVVKEYKELEEKTKQFYEELCNKYNTEGVVYIDRTGYAYESGYELSEDIMDDISKKLGPDFNKEMDELNNKVRDIEALLTISDDKDYQLEVLKNYGLLDKKGNIVR